MLGGGVIVGDQMEREVARRLAIEARLGVVRKAVATASTPTPSSRLRMIAARSRSLTPMVVERDRRQSSPPTSAAAANP